jgi:MFS family permease
MRWAEMRVRSGLPLWLVISGLGVTQIIGWGTTYYALGALSQDIAASMGWSKALIFGAFSAALLLSGLISAWAGRLIDRVGGRRVMMAGSVLSAAGLAIIGLFPHPATYIAGWLVLGLAMRLATYDAAFASLAQIAGAGARRAISYLTLFGGLASTVFWPVSHYLSLGIGWPNALMAYAVLHLVLCLPIHALVLREANGDGEDRAAPPAEARRRLPMKRAAQGHGDLRGGTGTQRPGLLRDLRPCRAAVRRAGLQGGGGGVHGGPDRARAGGEPAGRDPVGRQAPRHRLGLIAFGLLPVAIGLFAGLGFSWPAAIIFALLYGASNGLVTIAKGAVPLMLFGPKGYGEVLGIISAPNLVLNAAAPLLFALLLSAASAQTALMVAGAAALASSLFMLWLSRLHGKAG